MVMVSDEYATESVEFTTVELNKLTPVESWVVQMTSEEHLLTMAFVHWSVFVWSQNHTYHMPQKGLAATKGLLQVLGTSTARQ